MSSDGVPFLLITANVGSIFEEPSVMLKIWTEEFLSTLSRLDPKFIALHCQEVGGKNYAESMRHVEDFVRLLMNSEELRLFDKVRVFLDEDFSSAEHFTALGNLYFAHETLKDVLLWDFKEGTFVPVNGREIHSGNIEAITTKEKAKFPQDFFPECKWSRKGFLRTRWSVRGTVFDLINIHLFHDASNFIAMETFPSVYSKTRRRALEHTLDRFHNDHYANAPYFLFGDFNFRTDTAGVIKKLTADTRESKQSNKGSLSKLQFRNENDDLILTLGKKEFSHHEHQQVFIENSGQWLREYDKELGDFEGRLFEFPIKFVPSYPFEEDVKEGTNYMQTRVPAWCDRVLLSPTAKSLVKDVSSPSAIEYGIIGPLTCMGDHKPVYLRAILASDAGMINCCSSEGSELCFRVPESYSATERLPITTKTTNLITSPLVLSSPPIILPGCRSCARAAAAAAAAAAATATTVDESFSNKFLHAVPLKHDPYTPDSMDSPSPNAIAVISENVPPDLDELLRANNDDQQLEIVQAQRQVQQVPVKHMERAVSPALLKSKLELIVERRRRDRPTRSGSASASNSNSDVDEDLANPDTGQWSARKSRSNSDVSWQRSHLLTRAWLQGKGQQAYHSFSSSLHRMNDDHRQERRFIGDSSNNQPPQHCLLSGDLIIPRIAIINASNFESNASSVHLHDESCSKKAAAVAAASLGKTQPPSDQYLDSWYANTRTRSLSEADSSPGRSATALTLEEDEAKEKLEQEEEKMSKEEPTKDLVVNVETLLTEKDAAVGEAKVVTSVAIGDVRQESMTTASKNTTRSNSIQSQEANVSLKLKAYNKVTERCKRNIVGKKGRCEKCCVVS